MSKLPTNSVLDVILSVLSNLSNAPGVPASNARYTHRCARTSFDYWNQTPAGEKSCTSNLPWAHNKLLEFPNCPGSPAFYTICDDCAKYRRVYSTSLRKRLPQPRMGRIQVADLPFVSPNEIESTIWYFLGTTVCTVSVLDFDVEPF
jgi:hypothetical protein